MMFTELPKKNISFKKGKNVTKYVYLAVNRYRNKNGVPTSTEVSIGKLEPNSGLLITNKNFAKYFPEAKYLSQAEFEQIISSKLQVIK
ncbi:hypothetical protein [Psittacicella gerlachiana]|uniref:Uncharacterized protein n=1 Tax=Psittacicella gerlachiana TaxID=2028574 RepID=A0A3A1YAU0_9GAMM|nr:hypothetical protein [Psittacicella gerlachiana]RIY34298.1 hypothetical protein CKF59_05665 [Psittacicella gerlachiana]